MNDWQTPEDLFKGGDELAKKAKETMEKFKTTGPVLLLLFVVIATLLSGIFSVGTDEVGVIRRFGKYVRTVNPGLNFKIPFIENVNKVKVTYVFKEEFGFRTTKAGIASRYSTKNYTEESLMLTGDLNVLEVEWIVQFKVKDPVKLLFNVREPLNTVRNISQSVMREVVGDSTVNEVLTTRRVEINLQVQEKLQNIMDLYDSGIQIVVVKLQNVNPPDAVKPSFNEVNAAKQEKEKMINQAWEAYNKVIPKAKGEAEKTIREAEGYALERVNKAKGDAAKFTATYDAYKGAKEVTRKRLYLETMGEILPKIGKKFIFDQQQNAVLPFLDLTKEGGVK
ncbi:MAG: FtsH protease activity modulator HflK [Candidatus Omnitrophica bacterium]|nr:FtsH protease activity modulator HflK [Candidatus Omnitrophota bacterium]